jgi:hypothetical protein
MIWVRHLTVNLTGRPSGQNFKSCQHSTHCVLVLVGLLDTRPRWRQGHGAVAWAEAAGSGSGQRYTAPIDALRFAASRRPGVCAAAFLLPLVGERLKQVTHLGANGARTDLNQSVWAQGATIAGTVYVLHAPLRLSRVAAMCIDEFLPDLGAIRRQRGKRYRSWSQSSARLQHGVACWRG